MKRKRCTVLDFTGAATSNMLKYGITEATVKLF